MLSEISTKETQARAFSFFAFAGNVGIFLGPFLGMMRYITAVFNLLTSTGGGLANPAQQFPSIFKGIAFFEEYPYALSTIVPATFGFSAAVINAIFLKEVYFHLCQASCCMLTAVDTRSRGHKGQYRPKHVYISTTKVRWCFDCAISIRPYHASCIRVYCRYFHW